MSSSAASWRDFSLPEGVELSPAQQADISAEVGDQLRELTGEAPDDTLVEFLMVMVSAHSKFGEVASQVGEVSEADVAEPLCQWLVGCVKRVAKIEPSAEEQLAAMRAQMEQLEADKRRLEMQLQRPQQQQQSAQPQGVSLAELRKKRRVEDSAASASQGATASSSSSSSSSNINDKSDNNNKTAAADLLAQQYLKFLESGFQGDFCAYEDSLKPESERAQRPPEETAPGPAAEPRKPHERANQVWTNPDKKPDKPAAPAAAGQAQPGAEGPAASSGNHVWTNPDRPAAHGGHQMWTNPGRPAAARGGNHVWTNPDKPVAAPSGHQVWTNPDKPVAAPSGHQVWTNPDKSVAAPSGHQVWTNPDKKLPRAAPAPSTPAPAAPAAPAPGAHIVWTNPAMQQPKPLATAAALHHPPAPVTSGGNLTWGRGAGVPPAAAQSVGFGRGRGRGALGANTNVQWVRPDLSQEKAGSKELSKAGSISESLPPTP